jgi:glycosyltransferase involved in cell wall biosynthesis
MNVLFIEPFYSGSHKAFLDGVQQYSRHDIYPVTMRPPWGADKANAGVVALSNRICSVEGDFDLIFATNLTNVVGLKGLLGDGFRDVPFVLYMHENAFTSLGEPGSITDLTDVYLSFLNLLSADRLLFSSQYHLDSLLKLLPDIIGELPDFGLKESIDQLKDKSKVLHPGLDLKKHDQLPDTRHLNQQKVILWNQRWAYEKNPAMFFRVMNRLDDADFKFRLILAGDNRGKKPPEFEKAWQRYGDRIIHIGYVDDFQSYSRFLHQADFVVSTARHEYFSVSVMEAIYCGCHPFLPYDLTYPELIPRHLKNPLLHAPTFYDDEDELFSHLRSVLRGENKPLPKSSLRNISTKYDWSRRIHDFDDELDSIGS